MAVLVILQQVGVQIGPLLAGAGIAGLALGFGAQNLVRDFLAGFFLVLENQVRVGDAVKVNGTWGIVEELNFRILVLRDLSGEVHIFPNGSVETLSNLSHEWSAYVFDLGVAYKENTDAVTEVIREVGAGLRADANFGLYIIADLEVFGVDEFADSAVVIKGRIKTKPLKQWIVGREFNRRIKQAFDEQGIEIPFPHRSVYFGEASRPFELLNSDAGRAAEKLTGSENN
jgi:small-conductance mechanosensitive channel